MRGIGALVARFRLVITSRFAKADDCKVMLKNLRQMGNNTLGVTSNELVREQ